MRKGKDLSHLRGLVLCYVIARRKISRYIDDISSIYRVLGGIDTIFHGEKSERRYFRKYRQNITDISARGDISEIFWNNRLWWQNIGDISEIYHWFFGDISPPSCNVIWWPRSRPCWSDSLDVIPMVIWRSNDQIAPSFWSNGQNWFSTVN